MLVQMSNRVFLPAPSLLSGLASIALHVSAYPNLQQLPPAHRMKSKFLNLAFQTFLNVVPTQLGHSFTSILPFGETVHQHEIGQGSEPPASVPPLSMLQI